MRLDWHRPWLNHQTGKARAIYFEPADAIPKQATGLTALDARENDFDLMGVPRW